MRKTLHILFISAMLQGLLQAQTPSVDQILQRYVTALGGKANLEMIHTMVLRGNIELPELRAKGTTAEYFKFPNHFAAVTDIAGRGTTRFVFDGHDGWQTDSKNKSTKASGAAMLTEVKFNVPIDDSSSQSRRHPHPLQKSQILASPRHVSPLACA